MPISTTNELYLVAFMKILLVGNGAREHAIAEKIAAEAELYTIMSRKNPAIAALSKEYWICDIHNQEKVAACVHGKDIDIGFASPDSVLAAGISDALAETGMLVASPTKAAARIEWDKGYMRTLMQNYKISGAPKFEIVDNEKDAERTMRDYGEVAIKPLGLTGGKGVKISGDHFTTIEEAGEYVTDVLKKDGKILIEEKLDGEEFSLQAFCDGTRVSTMPPVQDHKRAFEQDRGENTGGMGAYSTGKILPFMEQSDLEAAEKIMREVVHALKKDGGLFRGVLYGQFMAIKDGVRVIEFNARFGDPEAMNVLGVMESQISDVLLSIADGNLGTVKFSEFATVVKYLVPDGYPEKPINDSVIHIDKAAIAAEGAKAYYASVYENEGDGEVYTTKSRAMGIMAIAEKIEDAEQKAERACGHVKGPVWHRKDIGTAGLIGKRMEHMKNIRGTGEIK